MPACRRCKGTLFDDETNCTHLPLLASYICLLLIVTQTAVARALVATCFSPTIGRYVEPNEIGSFHRIGGKMRPTCYNSNVIGNLAKRTLSSVLIQFYGFATFTNACYRNHQFYHILETMFITCASSNIRIFLCVDQSHIFHIIDVCIVEL